MENCRLSNPETELMCAIKKVPVTGQSPGVSFRLAGFPYSRSFFGEVALKPAICRDFVSISPRRRPGPPRTGRSRWPRRSRVCSAPKPFSRDHGFAATFCPSMAEDRFADRLAFRRRF